MWLFGLLLYGVRNMLLVRWLWVLLGVMSSVVMW